MKYYIYPRGINGELLADVILFFESNAKIVFIDDSKENTSLGYYAKNGIDGKIFISSEKYYEKLAKNIENIGIKYYENGLKYFGNKINKFLKNNVKKENTIGIQLSGLSSEKHIGQIDIQLKKKRDKCSIYL